MSTLIPNSYQTPNVLVDQYMALLTPEEWVVLSYMARRIFGFQKDIDRISLSQFTDGITDRNGNALDYGTGLHHSAVRKALAGLIRYGLTIIADDGNPARHIPPAYAIQRDGAQIDRAGLEQRAAERLAVQRQRTASATTRRRGTSDDTRRGTSDDTRRGTSDVPTKPRGNPEETKGKEDNDDDSRSSMREAPAPEGRRSSSSSNPPAARREAGDEAPEQPPRGTSANLTERGAPQPPVPPGPLPPAVLSETRAWLKRELNDFERKLLLSLLAKYDTSLVLEGIAHAALNAGRTVNYLVKTLDDCTAAGRRPSDPKTTPTGDRNGTHHPPGSRSRGPSRRPVSPPLDEATIARYRAAPTIGELYPHLRSVPGQPEGSGSSD